MMVHKDNLTNIRGYSDKEAPETIHLLNRPKAKTS